MIDFIAEHAILTVFGGWILSLVATAIYRLYFHPLARFPGPKLAAVSWLYEFYFDWWKHGQYLWEVGRLHEDYGPIVRITPSEIHVNDPEFINEIYASGASGKKRDKDPLYCLKFGITKNLFGAIDHNRHRMKRQAENQYFSRAAVMRLHSMMYKKIDRLCDKLEAYAGTGTPVTLSEAFVCLTLDLAAQYSFGWSFNFIESPSPTFRPNFAGPTHKQLEMAHFMKMAPWLYSILLAIPVKVLAMISPDMGLTFAWFKQMDDAIVRIKRDHDDNKLEEKEHVIVFEELLDGNLPPEYKTVESLGEEGRLTVGAGGETVAWTLSVTMFNLLANPSIKAKLQEELEKAIPESTTHPSQPALEAIPYLYGIIMEGLRLSYGIVARSPRRPHEPLLYKPSHRFPDHQKQYLIPPFTPVSMSHHLIHHNEDIFPDPLKFIPERWLTETGERRKELEAYLMSFSKGTRLCLGINFAYAELYHIIFTMVRRFGNRFELYETDVSDVELAWDCFAPAAKVGTQGVRVLIKGKE